MKNPIQPPECSSRPLYHRAETTRSKPTSSFKSLKDKGKIKRFPFLEEDALKVLQKAINDEKASQDAFTPFSSSLSCNALHRDCLFSIEEISCVNLAPEMMELFEKSVNAMAHQNFSGVSETTFYLDSPYFQGSKVVITEFNTAPKAFNISLVGTPEASALFSLHASELLSAFEKTPFKFTVHRLESNIEEHIFHRKESVGDEKEQRESEQ